MREFCTFQFFRSYFFLHSRHYKRKVVESVACRLAKRWKQYCEHINILYRYLPPRVSESEGSFLNSTSIALQEQPSCPWGCVLAAVFPTFQVLCTCCGNTSILVIGKKSYTFKYTKKPPTNCKNSNILKMSLGPTSGIWNFYDFFMFQQNSLRIFTRTTATYIIFMLYL